MFKFPLLLAASVTMCLCLGEPASAQKGKTPRNYADGGKSSKGVTTPEAEFERGNAAFDHKEWATAVTHYTSALRQKPEYVPALINRGRARLFSGKAADALPDLRKACELSPDLAATHTWLAAACLDAGDHGAAIDAAAKALKLDAKQALAWYVRGTALIHKGELARAIADLDEAAKLSPNDAVIFNNRGIAWQKLGDEKKAAADFDRRDQLQGKPTAAGGASPSKRAAYERMKQAEAQYKAIDAEVEVYERTNDTLRRMRPPQSVAIPPQLLQRRAAAWNALQEARRAYEAMP